MVLDSTVDPQGAWWTDNIDQDYAFEGRIKAFFAWMASYDSVYHLGSTAAQVSQSWYAARADLAAHPIPGPSGQPLIGPDEFDDTMLIGGYDNSYWPGLAAALSAYLNDHSTSQLVTQYEQEGTQNENEFAVYNAVECADVNWPRNWAHLELRRPRRSTRPRRSRPGTTRGSTRPARSGRCTGPSTPLRINGAGLPGILMLQGTLDAATPYAGAQAAHRLLPSARMVVVEGGGNHGQSLVGPAEPVRGRLPEPVPGHRRAAAGPGTGERDLPGPARPDAVQLRSARRRPAGNGPVRDAVQRRPG